MGRTNPTYRNRLDRLEQEWNDYRRALRASEQERFDQLLEHGHEYAHAAGHLNHPSPAVALLLSMLLAHERRLDEFDDRLTTLSTQEENGTEN